MKHHLSSNQISYEMKNRQRKGRRLPVHHLWICSFSLDAKQISDEVASRASFGLPPSCGSLFWSLLSQTLKALSFTPSALQALSFLFLTAVHSFCFSFLAVSLPLLFFFSQSQPPPLSVFLSRPCSLPVSSHPLVRLLFVFLLYGAQGS